MKETCWRLFSYLVIDHAAAQEQLDRWAGEGWALEKLRLDCFAKLRRTRREDLRYFIDFTDPKRWKEEACGDYYQLCSDAGWELVEEASYWNIYASKPGAVPSPIQTDPALEYARYRSKVTRRMCVGATIVVFFMLLYALLILVAGRSAHLGRFSPAQLLSFALTETFSIPYLLCTLPLLLLWGLVYLGLLCRRMVRWKRDAAEGRPLSGAGTPMARAWGWVKLTALVLSWLFFLCFLADALLNRFVTWSYILGALIGALIVLCGSRYSDQHKRHAVYLIIFVLLLALCSLLNRPLRAVWNGRVPGGPVTVGMELMDERRQDALLGSHAQWRERPAQTPSRYAFKYSVEVRCWATEALADWAFEQLDLSGATALSDGLWTEAEIRWGDWYLLRRGRSWVEVTCLPDEAPEVLAALELWAEQLP